MTGIRIYEMAKLLPGVGKANSFIADIDLPVSLSSRRLRLGLCSSGGRFSRGRVIHLLARRDPMFEHAPQAREPKRCSAK